MRKRLCMAQPGQTLFADDTERILPLFRGRVRFFLLLELWNAEASGSGYIPDRETRYRLSPGFYTEQNFSFSSCTLKNYRKTIF